MDIHQLLLKNIKCLLNDHSTSVTFIKVMTKYQEYYNRMIESNKELFDEFRKVHDTYALHPDENQDEFNSVGDKVMEAMREWENKLCMQSEKGGYAHFTTGLAEKFKNVARKDFPEIDNIGLIVNNPGKKEGDFSIKKINLTS